MLGIARCGSQMRLRQPCFDGEVLPEEGRVPTLPECVGVFYGQVLGTARLWSQMCLQQPHVNGKVLPQEGRVRSLYERVALHNRQVLERKVRLRYSVFHAEVLPSYRAPAYNYRPVQSNICISEVFQDLLYLPVSNDLLACWHALQRGLCLSAVFSAIPLNPNVSLICKNRASGCQSR